MADPIWLQKLKRALSGESTPLGAPGRPEFTGTAGYNQPATVNPDYNNVLGLAKQGALVDPHLAAAAGGPGWGSGMAPSTMTKVPAFGKKGLSVKNMINAMSKLKSPTGEDFSRVSGRTGGRRPTAPSPRALGVDALEMASADDPRKKWWKQWQGLMGA
jgi:hypothetical protein